MDVPASFPTKTGTCTITATQLVLARTGVRGGLAQALLGDSTARIFVVYGLVAVGLAVVGVFNLRAGATGSALLDFGVAAYVAVRLLRSRNVSAAAVIDRATIRGVTAHPPVPPLTRGYFRVRFHADGRDQERYILLPGSLFGGGAAYEHAVTVLRAEGLL